MLVLVSNLWRTMAIMLAALLASAGAPLIQAQNAAEAFTRSSFDRVALYMLFLNQRASELSLRPSGESGVEDDLIAARLSIKSSEVAAVNREAVAYVAVDRAIHSEALKYRDECRAAKKPLDPTVVASFTDRRIAGVNAVMDGLRSQLSPESFVGLRKYVENQFARGVHVEHVR